MTNAADVSDATKPICFIVMGFHKKVAYDKDEKPRELDLDASYRSIIKPSVEEAGLRCVRADEVQISGLIDRPMYEMLLSADLVIADISTGNVNAVYELGVRHALRPHRTILMFEDQAKFHFDLNHLSSFTYPHGGADVPHKSVEPKRKGLTKLIREVMGNEQVDSPVFGHLEIPARKITKDDRARMFAVLERESDRLARHLTEGTKAVGKDDWGTAISELSMAREMIEGLPDDTKKQNRTNYDFVLQQLALATYKNGKPNKGAALQSGLQIISWLNPDDSHDTETLGIAGAIRKRLWEFDNQRPHLEKAIDYYGRGFALKQDYYNGENYATCLMMRSRIQEDDDEKQYDRMTAKKARKEIVRILTAEFESGRYGALAPKVRMWMDATMANCLFALEQSQNALIYEARFKVLATAEWQLKTYADGKQAVLAEKRL